MNRVFLTDGQTRKTLAVVRTLAKKGVLVTVGEETNIAISRFSKYCHKFIIYPSPKEYPMEFYRFVLRHIKENKYDVE